MKKMMLRLGIIGCFFGMCIFINTMLKNNTYFNSGMVGILFMFLFMVLLFRTLRRISSDRPKAYYPSHVDEMDGHEFEYFCGDLLEENNFYDIRVTKGSGDQGVDILASKDGIKYAIQCKCYSKNVGNDAVQQVFAGKTFYQCHVGAVITNQYFTKSAHELAQRSGVLLWDRDYLMQLMES
jgi:restriction system protein